VITADDLGIDPQRDAGILRCFAAGAISQASLMVRGRSADEAAAKATRAGLPLGLHLDLTETPPSAPAGEVSSLLGPDGDKLGKHGLRAALEAGAIDPAHIEAETRAQLARFEALVGAPPRHVDGHQHVHTVPALAKILAPILASAGVRTTRIPEQHEVRVHDPATAGFYRGVARDGAASRPVYARERIGSTEAFIGLDLMGRASGVEAIGMALADLPDAASIELMCHPGFVGTGGDEFNRSPDREHELGVLCSDEMRALIGGGDLDLASFAELPNAADV
jgi:predicted glycoside hydrolase/deacetylase ChbG (UPF0249 family)